MAPKSAILNGVLSDYSIELKPSIKPGFTVPAAWTTELLSRLQKAGVQVDPKFRDVAAKLLTRDLEIRVARQALGDAEVRKRTLTDDRQLQRAIEILNGVTTQQDLLKRVTK
jgi:hypothetical protein